MDRPLQIDENVEERQRYVQELEVEMRAKYPQVFGDISQHVRRTGGIEPIATFMNRFALRRVNEPETEDTLGKLILANRVSIAQNPPSALQDVKIAATIMKVGCLHHLVLKNKSTILANQQYERPTIQWEYKNSNVHNVALQMIQAPVALTNPTVMIPAIRQLIPRIVQDHTRTHYLLIIGGAIEMSRGPNETAAMKARAIFDTLKQLAGLGFHAVYLGTPHFVLPGDKNPLPVLKELAKLIADQEQNRPARGSVRYIDLATNEQQSAYAQYHSSNVYSDEQASYIISMFYSLFDLVLRTLVQQDFKENRQPAEGHLAVPQAELQALKAISDRARELQIKGILGDNLMPNVRDPPPTQ